MRKVLSALLALSRLPVQVSTFFLSFFSLLFVFLLRSAHVARLPSHTPFTDALHRCARFNVVCRGLRFFFHFFFFFFLFLFLTSPSQSLSRGVHIDGHAGCVLNCDVEDVNRLHPLRQSTQHILHRRFQFFESTQRKPAGCLGL